MAEKSANPAARATLRAGLAVTAFVTILKIASFLGFTVLLLGQIELLSIDARFRLRGRKEPTAKIVIAAIDDPSVEELGRWPWPRDIHSRLVHRLHAAGAEMVGFDVFFSEPEVSGASQVIRKVRGALPRSSTATKSERDELDEFRRSLEGWASEEDHDQILAEALQIVSTAGMPVVLPVVFGASQASPEIPGESFLPDPQPGTGYPEDNIRVDTALLSIPKIAQASPAHGFIMPIYPDPDGTYRSMPLYVDYKGKLVPSLAIQLARIHLGLSLDEVEVAPGLYVQLGGRQVPVDTLGRMNINFRGGTGAFGKKATFPIISIRDILSGAADQETLKDSIVLIGPTSTGIYDIRATPFAKIFPGVEIHANIVDNLIAGDFLTPVVEGLNLLLVLGLSLLAVFLFRKTSAGRGAFVAMGLAAAYVGAAQALFNRGIIVDLVYPLLGFFLSYLAILVTRSRHESREKERIKDIFSKFVTKDVMNEILRQPGDVAMGGQERELSVLFSDIAGFTTISEAHKPAEVVALLNEYLTEMTREVFATQGTLDKYIGDAVMAVWGAPLAHKNHAERACRTALGMRASLKKLNERWTAAGRTTIDIRVGIHTGNMVVGVMGSQARYEYTCIGDGVNLASRLEGTNKVYGTPIIISESTRAQVKDIFVNRELDAIKVKGKTQGVGIFEIVSDENASPAVRALYKAYEEGLAAYRKLDFEKALDHFNEGLRLVPNDGPSKVFVERCRWFVKNPPLEGWDGIFTMKTK